MLTPESLAAFALASVLLIVIPGPSVLFVIGRSLSYGRRGGLMSVFGNELGALPLVAAISFGVGAIVAQSIMVFTIIKLLGAAYLVFLGVQAIRHRREGLTDASEQETRTLSPAVLLRQGFIVGVTNPKTIVFFVAVLPQFVSFQTGAILLQMMTLGFVFVAITFACDAMWALLAGTAQSWLVSSPRRLIAIRAAGGSLMIGLAGGLALTGSKA